MHTVAFLGRFLQHVLPQGFPKVRYYGLFSPARPDLLAQAREQLMAASSSPVPAEAPIAPATVPEIGPRSRCPACGIGVLHLVEILHPCGRSP
ncbi:MAG TPA: transposase [Methylomirabilota bacterium]